MLEPDFNFKTQFWNSQSNNKEGNTLSRYREILSLHSISLASLSVVEIEAGCPGQKVHSYVVYSTLPLYCILLLANFGCVSSGFFLAKE